MGEFKTRLAFADENLRQEGARQRALERCLARIANSLEEARMMGVDVMEENHALRAKLAQYASNSKSEGRQQPCLLPSPLDSQLHTRSMSHDSSFNTVMSYASSAPIPPSTTATTTMTTTTTTSPTDDLASFQRAREARKAREKAKAQRERHAAFEAIPQSFHAMSQQQRQQQQRPSLPCHPRGPLPARPTFRRSRSTALSSSTEKQSSVTCAPAATGPQTHHKLQSAKRLPRPPTPCVHTRGSSAASVGQDWDRHRDPVSLAVAAQIPFARRETAPDLGVGELALDLARFRTAPA